MTNKFAFSLLVVSLTASTGYKKTGTEMPISEIGLFGSQLPRAAAGEAPETPPHHKSTQERPMVNTVIKSRLFPLNPALHS